MSTQTGYITTNDGVRLFYERVGTGPTMLLIPNGPPLIQDFTRFASTRTVIFYDARNRGRSDQVSDDARLARGIDNDVDDMEAVRRHFGVDRVDLFGHSYLGLAVILYAMKYPNHVNRVVQVGAVPPDPSTKYSPELSGADETLRSVLAKLEEVQRRPPAADPEQRCREVWSILRVIYVVNPADVGKLDFWQRCDLPNERNAMTYWNEKLQPSIRAVTPRQLSVVTMPVLTVHGRKDRSGPYGGARDWASMLPNGRLLTMEDTGHVPWIDKPGPFFSAVDTFLDGAWPDDATQLLPPV